MHANAQKNPQPELLDSDCNVESDKEDGCTIKFILCKAVSELLFVFAVKGILIALSAVHSKGKLPFPAYLPIAMILQLILSCSQVYGNVKRNEVNNSLASCVTTVNKINNLSNVGGKCKASSRNKNLYGGTKIIVMEITAAIISAVGFVVIPILKNREIVNDWVYFILTAICFPLSAVIYVSSIVHRMEAQMMIKEIDNISREIMSNLENSQFACVAQKDDTEIAKK